MTVDTRPLPVADALTRPYWDAARDRRFLLPRCDACARFHFYPRSVCPHCGADAITWSAASGRGTVFSATQVERAPSAAFAPPYLVAVVALEEGPHLMSTVIGCDPAAVKVGMPVMVDFLECGEATLPVFRPSVP